MKLWDRFVAWTKEPSQTVMRLRSAQEAAEYVNAERERIAALPRKCSTCCFYDNEYCRRMPPSIGNNGRVGEIPRVHAGAWCGEWRPKGNDNPFAGFTR